MSVQVEELEKNKAKLTVEVSLEDLDKAMNVVYNRQKGKIAIPGFRKGKAPRRMIERLYGKGVFLEDAINEVLPDAYDKAVKESGLEVVSRPQIGFEQTEPDKPLIFTAQVATKPDVTLGEYKGVEVPKMVIEVTDQEIDDEIRREQEKNARTITVSDRPAKAGDIVTLDYAGTVDGVPFDGGTASGQTLTLGSNTFIPGFEDQLIGAQAGSHVDVHVTFPEDYHEASLAGADALFACDIIKIEVKELPELDDEFAQDVSDYNTFEEYRNSVKAKIEESKTEQEKAHKEDAAINAVIRKAEMDIPEEMIEFQIDNMMDDFANQLRMSGMDPEQYFKMTGLSMDSMRTQMRANAIQRIQTRLVLEKVAEAEGLEASEEELNADLEKMAASYRLNVEDVRKTLDESQLDQMRKDIVVRKAIDVLVDAAVETDSAAAE